MPLLSPTLLKAVRAVGKVVAPIAGVSAGTIGGLGLMGAGPRAYFETLEHVDPGEAHPRSVLARSLAILTAGTVAPTLRYARVPSVQGITQTYTQGYNIFRTQAQLQRLKYSPIAQFKTGLSRGFAEQRARYRSYPVRPYPQSTQGPGYPSWFRGKGRGMPVGHLGMDGSMAFSLHKLRHRGTIGIR